MKKAIRDAWMQSLRSGLYPQIQWALCRKENGGLGFCCLGVLADVADPTAWGTPPEHAGGIRYFAGVYSGALPADLRTEVGLPEEAERTLIALNDKEGKTFPEIAAWIEQNIPAEAA